MEPYPKMIDFTSHVPYYAQLIDLIKEQIKHKVWLPGDRIPGEPDLCKNYRVSRTVVRQALRELEQEGLIVRRKGKGTFITYPKIGESLAQKLTGFYADMVGRGFNPVTTVLHHRISPATEKIGGFLQIKVGTQVADICRLRSVNNEPIQLVTSYLPFHLCPQIEEVDLTNLSLNEFLENECGLVIARGRRYIEAVAVGEEEARLLQINRSDPLVSLESISFLGDGTPIEYYQSYHRGDRSRFEVDLVRTPALI